MRLGDMDVGDRVWIALDGTDTRFTIVQQGKRSGDDESFSGGTVLILGPNNDGVAETRFGLDGSGKESKCSYRNTWGAQNYLSDEGIFAGMLDEGVRAQVMTVRIPCRKGTEGAETELVEAKYWLPSLEESARTMAEQDLIFGWEYRSPWIAEGSVFPYWDGKSSDDYDAWIAPRSSGKTGPLQRWLTRTPVKSSNTLAFYAVDRTGIGYPTNLGDICQMRPCMVLPGESIVSGGTLVTGQNMSVRVGGVWKQSEGLYCKTGGVWRRGETLFAKNGGVWRQA